MQLIDMKHLRNAICKVQKIIELLCLRANLERQGHADVT